MAQITAVPWIAAIVVLAVILVALATFTDALKKLHEFGKSMWAEFKERRGPDEKLKKEFDVLRRNVLYCGIANDIPVELHKLRTFLVENDFVERPHVTQFFDKWLSSPWVVRGIPVVNAFTYEQIEVLVQELRRLQL